MMICRGSDLELPPMQRGVHLIDAYLRPVVDVSDVTVGLLHIHCLHTSASLAINESYDPTVRDDVRAWFDRLAPDGDPLYRHSDEGDDDMPAHLKSLLTGCAVTIPIRSGAWALGTWQGVYLCEHRNYGGLAACD